MAQSRNSHMDVGAFSGPEGPESIQAQGKSRFTRILVVMPNWVGDVVMATPALRALRERFADAHIGLLLKGHLAEILNGGIWMDEVIHWPAGKGKSRPKRRQGFLGLAAELRDRQFDLAVLLANSFRSALLARLAGIRRRVGYDRDGRGMLLTDRLLPAKVHGNYLPMPMVDYYNAVAKYLGCRDCSQEMELHTTPEEESTAQQAIKYAAVRVDQPIVVLNPGASFGSAKCWPAERFAEVGDKLVTGFKAAIFVSCAPNEIDIAQKVADNMRQPVTVLNKPVMKLGPSKALIRSASLLITNDTGPRHFAKALGTPVVTIFGPTDPRWSSNKCPTERCLMVKVDCGPCMKRECPVDHRCMTRITSDLVFEQARELLKDRIAVAVK
ncbi:MAG: lipopolysaccharide heptosyltransferase II [Planctomycetota bacterium]|nr:MAG: lipopolysaccharide heptosyltransferase II [Planctomycetota bacterium]